MSRTGYLSLYKFAVRPETKFRCQQVGQRYETNEGYCKMSKTWKMDNIKCKMGLVDGIIVKSHLTKLYNIVYYSAITHKTISSISDYRFDQTCAM